MADPAKSSEGSVPVPDPTSLTTQALIREIEGLRASTEKDLAMTLKLIEARLDGNDKALNAALSASAAAIAKSEAAINKQLDQIGHLISTTNSAANDKVEDVKTRLTTIESRKQGGTEVWGVVMGVAALVVAMLVGILALVRP